MNDMKQAHFFSLPTQGNIYTIANLHLSNNTNKLLVASLKRQVFCFEYIENSTGILVPTTKEVSFTYIPSGAEIISIDAFNKSEERNDFVIGITIIKNNIDNTALETYLNIYSQESKEFNIESIAQNCLNVELNFTPYQLTHTYMVSKTDDEITGKEKVFILSGSDNTLHVFSENAESHHMFKEIDSKESFPEFLKPPSVVLWVDIKYYDDYKRRVSAIGCECGYLRLLNICCKTNNILFNMSTQFISSISHIKIFTTQDELKKPSIIDKFDNALDDEDSIINMVIVNSIVPSVLFQNIVKYGLKSPTTLRRSDPTSISTCFTPADIYLSGEKELIVGNSCEFLMCYKVTDDEAKMVEIRKLVSPIFHLDYLDITGDGVRELIVFTMKGVYILQHEPKLVKKILETKISRVTIPDICNLDNLEVVTET